MTSLLGSVWVSSALLPQHPWVDPTASPQWNCVSSVLQEDASHFPLGHGGFILLPVPIFQPGYPEDKACFVTVSP